MTCRRALTCTFHMRTGFGVRVRLRVSHIKTPLRIEPPTLQVKGQWFNNFTTKTSICLGIVTPVCTWEENDSFPSHHCALGSDTCVRGQPLVLHHLTAPCSPP